MNTLLEEVFDRARDAFAVEPAERSAADIFAIKQWIIHHPQNIWRFYPKEFLDCDVKHSVRPVEEPLLRELQLLSVPVGNDVFKQGKAECSLLLNASTDQFQLGDVPSAFYILISGECELWYLPQSVRAPKRAAHGIKLG